MGWIGFGLSLLVLLGLARFNIWGAMAAGAFVLGLFSLPWGPLLSTMARALAAPGVLVLSLAVGFIPLIGAALEKGGWFSPLLAVVPGGRRTVFAAVPALFGLLPIPGGALLSAPILEKTGGGTPEGRAAANVWFRHVLLFFYPMSSALIAAAKLAGFDVWTVLPYQIPWAIFAASVGGFFLLGPFRGPKPKATEGRGLRDFFPLVVLLLAPTLDFALKRWAALPVPELSTLLALSASFLLAVCGLSLRDLPGLFWKATPWRFSLILAGMFLYLGVFQASGLPEKFASLNLPVLGVVLGLGILMGLATGRQQAAVSVVIPIYLAAKGSLTPWGFSALYQATYLGYLLSPLHPCLAVSVEYAGAKLGATWKLLFLPSLVLLAAVVLASLFVL
jgi:integral membrane protein (TIGR00529 family)